NKKVIKKEDHGLALTLIKQATRTRYKFNKRHKKTKSYHDPLKSKNPLD
ncbi:hypothetical protein D929_01912, partial [Enterococcus faecalis 02-MB-P-10]